MADEFDKFAHEHPEQEKSDCQKLNLFVAGLDCLVAKIEEGGIPEKSPMRNRG